MNIAILEVANGKERKCLNETLECVGWQMGVPERRVAQEVTEGSNITLRSRVNPSIVLNLIPYESSSFVN